MVNSPAEDAPYNDPQAKSLEAAAKKEEERNRGGEVARTAWHAAAVAYRPGAASDAYAASRAIHCFRKAGDLEEASRVGLAARNRWPDDSWIGRNLAWVFIDRAKTDDDLPARLQALQRVFSFWPPQPDAQRMLADNVIHTLSRIANPPRDERTEARPVPFRERQRAIAAFLVEHGEALLKSADTRGHEWQGRQQDPPAERLGHLARKLLRDTEEWAAMERLMALGRIRCHHAFVFFAGFVESLLGQNKAQAALDLLDERDPFTAQPTRYRLKAKALIALDRLPDALAGLEKAVLVFNDPWMWRDLAEVYWRAKRIADSQEALAVGLALLSPEEAPNGWRLHMGRAAGAIRLDDYATVALETLTAMNLRELKNWPSNPQLSDLHQRVHREHPDWLHAAQDAFASETRFLHLRAGYFVAADRRLRERAQPVVVTSLPHTDEPGGVDIETEHGVDEGSLPANALLMEPRPEVGDECLAVIAKALGGAGTPSPKWRVLYCFPMDPPEPPEPPDWDRLRAQAAERSAPLADEDFDGEEPPPDFADDEHGYDVEQTFE